MRILTGGERRPFWRCCGRGRPAPTRSYVSNEKDNTMTVVDTATWRWSKTVPVGQRPRGITISHDGKFVYLCASDDDTVEVIDTATLEIVGTLPSGPDPELFVAVARRQDALCRQRGRQSGHRRSTSKPGKSWPRSRSAWSRKGWASPGRQVHGQHLRDDQHGAFHRHPTHEITANVLVDSRPRFAEFKPDGSEVWVSAEVGGTVSVIDTATPRGEEQDHLRDPGLARRGDPAGRHQDHQGRQEGLSSRSARRTGWRWSTRDLRGGEIRAGRPAGRGSSPSRPTRRPSSRPTATPTTSPSSMSPPTNPSNPSTVGGLPWGVVVSPN